MVGPGFAQSHHLLKGMVGPGFAQSHHLLKGMVGPGFAQSHHLLKGMVGPGFAQSHHLLKGMVGLRKAWSHPTNSLLRSPLALSYTFCEQPRADSQPNPSMKWLVARASSVLADTTTPP